MKPTETELRQLTQQDLRLRIFKEKNFDDAGHYNPVAFAKWLLAFFVLVITVMFLLSYFLS